LQPSKMRVDQCSDGSIQRLMRRVCVRVVGWVDLA
jgi:hypothetical protein